ncbi:MAG: helix-turn-helix domain-containing protein [Nocardioides sp.]
MSRTADGEPPAGRPEAIVRPTEAARHIDVQRVDVAERWALLVDYLWYVGWDLGAAEPFEQQVVPQPRVHLAAEGGRLLVHGISREPFVRRLADSGHTLGAAFHHGGFRPLLGVAVSTLADRVVPAAEVLGVDDRACAAAIAAADDLAVMVAALEAYLDQVGDEADLSVGQGLAQVRELVRLVEADRTITRAEQLADHAASSLRSLQRLFGDYVGIGPKWVIARCRILDAAATAHRGDPVDWAALAVELGFSDQAHLTRAFTQVVGTPPETYRREA